MYAGRLVNNISAGPRGLVIDISRVHFSNKIHIHESKEVNHNFQLMDKDIILLVKTV